jgi:hypothetical protein
MAFDSPPVAVLGYLPVRDFETVVRSLELDVFGKRLLPMLRWIIMVEMIGRVESKGLAGEGAHI